MSDLEDQRIEEIMEATTEVRENLGEAFGMLIDEFAREIPTRLRSMRAAHDAADGEDIRASAHAIKGSLSVFGLPDLTKAAGELEALGAAGDLGASEPLIQLLEREIIVVLAALKRIQADIPSSE